MAGLIDKSKLVNEDAARRALQGGHPLVVTFNEFVAGDVRAIKGTLLIDALGTKAGTRVTIREAEGVYLRNPLSASISGTEREPKLAGGEIIAFASAYVHAGEARVGEVSARTHDGLEGHVQVITAMARPSQSSVSKKGATQSLTVTDGKGASLARSYEDISRAFAGVSAREWPGGAAGFIFRFPDGEKGEFFEDRDAGIDYLIGELRNVDTFANTGDWLELIPAWKLPMGRSQVIKDVDPRTETKPVSGPFTKLFESTGKGFVKRGFLPCLIIANDEDEWAFGGKTGKKIRVASAVQPVYRREPLAPAKLPSAIRPSGGTPNGVLTLYITDALERLASERAERSGRVSNESPAEDWDEGHGPSISRGLSKMRIGRR